MEEQMFRNYGRLLFSPEDGDGGQGGGAAGLDDTTPPVDDGGTPPVDDGGTPPVDDGGVDIPEWARDLELDSDIAGDPSLKVFKDVKSLAKSYVHAQKKLGMKGVMIPTENSTQEEWDTFYQKVGVPLEQDKYKETLGLKAQEGSSFDEAFNNSFAEKALELRVAPDKAKQMYEFFNEQATSKANTYLESNKAQEQEALNALMDTYGADAYNAGLSKALKYIGEELGKDSLEYLKESGLGRNAKVVDMFIKTANAFYKEDKLPTGGSSTVISKEEAQKEINMAMANPSDPYLNANHPDHKRRVDEIQKYFTILDK